MNLGRIVAALAKSVGRPPDIVRETAEVGDPGVYGYINDAVNEYLSALQNADTLVGKHGFKVYEEMYDRDGQVRSGLWYKAAISVSPQWKMDAASAQPVDRKWSDFAEYNLKHMRGSMNEVDWSLRRGAWGSGVAIMEIVWRVIDEPCPWKGMWGIEAIKPRYPDSMEFHPDRFGNLKGKGSLKQVQQSGKTVDLDPDKFIIYVNDKRWSNWWGNSDLKPAYPPYIFKKFLWSWWGICMERFGGPIPIIKYDDGTGEGEREKVMNVLLKMKLMNGIGVPKAWDIDQFSIATANTEGFDHAIQTCDKQIARAILVPELLQSEGQTHGSYGLGVMQYQGPFLSYLKFRIREAEDVTNEQLIHRLVRKNDPEGRIYEFPNFTREEIREAPDPQVLKLFEMILGKPAWSDGLDPELAQWLSSQTGVPVPRGVADKPTDDIDETATKANELLALMAEDWKSDGHKITRLSPLRTLLRGYARQVSPTIEAKLADELAAAQVGAWAKTLRLAAEKSGDVAFSEFSAQDALWRWRKELKADA